MQTPKRHKNDTKTFEALTVRGTGSGDQCPYRLVSASCPSAYPQGRWTQEPAALGTKIARVRSMANQVEG
jgi:hypothetical protein